MRFTLDTHTHTIASGHAYNTIDEMAVYAAGHGVTHLAITDHAPKMPGSAGVLYFSNIVKLSLQRTNFTIILNRVIVFIRQLFTL